MMKHIKNISVRILLAFIFSSACTAQIYTLTIDPSNGEIYSPDTKKNLLKSPDDGKTWSFVDLGIAKDEYSYLLHVAVYAPRSLICILQLKGDRARLLKSTDGAKSWENIEVPDSAVQINSVTIDPEVNNVVWLTGDDQVWRLDLVTDLVTDVKPAGLRFFEKYIITPQDPTIRWLSSDVEDAHSLIRGRLFKSTDSGNTWQLILDSTSNPIREIIIDPSDKDHVFITSRSLRETHDGGTTWIDRGVPDTLVHKFLGQLAIDWTNGIMYSETTSDSTFKSIDFGQSWKSMPIPKGWTNDIVLHTFQNCRVFVVQTDGLYESTDCGETFTKQQFKIIPTGLETLSASSLNIISIFPNPYWSKSGVDARLKLVALTGQQISIKVFDLLGRTVMDEVAMPSNQHETIVPLRLSSLSTGVYVVKVSSGIMTRTERFLVW